MRIVSECVKNILSSARQMCSLSSLFISLSSVSRHVAVSKKMYLLTANEVPGADPTPEDAAVDKAEQML